MLMKKIFTLIAFALLAGGVSAQTSWNFSDWEAKDYSETVTIDGLTVTATADAKVTIDGSNKTVDEIKYTQRLKTGGSGGENSRTLSFAVDGACKVDVVLCSASGSDNRLLNVCAGTYKKEEYLAQLDAVAGDPVKQTYTYTGEATTIYLGSYNSGINIYAIYVTPADDSTGIQNVVVDVNNGAIINLAGQKVDENYKGIVVKNGKKYIQK